MVNKILIPVVVIVIVLAVVGIFLSKSGGQSMSTPTPVPSQESTPISGAITKEVTIESNEFSFSPSQITVEQGQNLKITFVNKGNFSHNFAIPDYGIKTNTIAGTETDTIEFVADKAGTFRIICTVTGHENLGMTGTLIVE